MKNHGIRNIAKKIRDYFYMIYAAVVIILGISVATSEISLLFGKINISHKEIKYTNAQVIGRPQTKMIYVKDGKETYTIGCGKEFDILCEEYFNKNIEIFDLHLVVINNSAIEVLGFRTKSGLEFKFDEREIINSRIETEKLFPRFFFILFLILTPIFFITLFLTYFFHKQNQEY